MAWTDERVETLKKLWAEGLSASQIANRLGGVTRNAVIGKVHRLGLSGRTTTSRAKAPRPRRRAVSKPTMRTTGPGFTSHGNTALKAFYEPDAEAVPERIPAPVHELVIPVSNKCLVRAYDAKTGEKVWTYQIETRGECIDSPPAIVE